MKSTLLTLLVFFSSVCYSQKNYMVVTFGDSSTRAYDLKSVEKLTFLGNPTTSAERFLVARVLRSFTLWQNYPNPFNPSTNIQFEIPSRGDVTVNVYDLAGRLVRQLDHGIRDAGIQTLQWDGRNNHNQPVATGVYFLFVRFNDAFMTKKLLLLK